MDERPALSDRIGLLRPMRHRDFRLLWIGQTVSMIGDGTYYVAVAWLVYQDLGRSAAAFAAVGVAWSLPQLLLLLASGALSDRMDRRHLMIAGDLLRLVSILTIGILTLADEITIPILLGLVIFYGSGQALFGPAFSSIIPSIVPEDVLVEANSVGQVVRPLAMTIIGPIVGGLLLVLGTGWAFVFDALTFGGSAICIGLMRARKPADEGPHEPMLPQIREGIAYVRNETWIFVALVTATVSLFCVWGPWETLMPLVITKDLNGSGVDLAFVFAAGGLGSVLVGILAAQRGSLGRRPLTVMYLAWALGMLMTAGFGLITAVWQGLLVAFVTEGSISLLIVIWFTALQRTVPDRFLGRVMSLDWMISIAGLPLSFAVVGPLAAWIGTDATLILAGVLGAAVTIAAMFIPGALAPERDGRLAGAPVSRS
jgi:predicted outer membrane lipoprotein